MTKAVLSIIFAYLIGAVPTGLLVGKVGYGVDVRQSGSGNIGTTNVRRVLGGKAAVIVFIVDVLKGFIAIAGPVWLINGAVGIPVNSGRAGSVLVVFLALAVIVGNMFSIFIKGKGGKGVAVASGAILAIVPQIAGILLLVWLAVMALTKYVSVASLSIAALFPLLMWIFHGSNGPYMVFAAAAMLMVFFSHRANIKRLIAREELRIDQGADRRS